MGAKIILKNDLQLLNFRRKKGKRQKEWLLKFLNFDSEGNYLWNIKARPASTEIAANEILLYPNPSESQLNIRYNFDKDSKLQIVDMLGIIVKEVFLSKDTKQVSLFVNDLAPGVYSYRQIYQNTTLNTGKLIIPK